jgi:3-dehydrosphinganine reductase
MLLQVAAGALVVVLVFVFLSNRRSKTVDRFANKHIVITGGSSGIGLALAQDFLTQSAPKKITLVARNKDGLVKAKTCLNSDSRVEILSLDVSDFNACQVATAGALADTDVLVNAAGLSIPAKLEDLTEAEIDTMVNVNLRGSVFLTKCVIGRMKARKAGHVVFVSSQAGQIGLYGFTVYSATKFALRGLAEALRMETLAHNVDVSLVFPADTETPGLAKENERKPKITKLLSETSGVMTADAVAKLIHRGMRERKFLITVNLDGWLLNMLSLGMATSPFFSLVSEVLLFPVLRLVGVGYALYFAHVVKKNDI